MGAAEIFKKKHEDPGRRVGWIGEGEGERGAVEGVRGVGFFFFFAGGGGGGGGAVDRRLL